MRIRRNGEERNHRAPGGPQEEGPPGPSEDGLPGGDRLNVRQRWTASRDELIGLDVEVETSTDPGLTGISGRVVDETRNLLVIRLDGGHVVRVPKRTATFRLEAEGRAVVLNGRLLAHRPEDRPKKIRMKHLRDDGYASSKEEDQEGARGEGHRRRR